MPETVYHSHWYGFSTLRMLRWPLRLICLKEPHIAHMIWFISSVVMKRDIIHLITHYTDIVYLQCVDVNMLSSRSLCRNLLIRNFDMVSLQYGCSDGRLSSSAKNKTAWRTHDMVHPPWWNGDESSCIHDVGVTHYTHMVYHHCGCEYACFYVLCRNLFITHFDTIQHLNFYQCFTNNIWLILQCMQPILKRATIFIENIN